MKVLWRGLNVVDRRRELDLPHMGGEMTTDNSQGAARVRALDHGVGISLHTSDDTNAPASRPQVNFVFVGRLRRRVPRIRARFRACSCA